MSANYHLTNDEAPTKESHGAFPSTQMHAAEASPSLTPRGYCGAMMGSVRVVSTAPARDETVTCATVAARAPPVRCIVGACKMGGSVQLRSPLHGSSVLLFCAASR